MSSFIGIQRIKENSKENILIICETLIKIVENVLKNPESVAARRIYLDSEDVLVNLMPFSGGLEALFEIGFEEESESFILPANFNQERLISYKTQLTELIQPKSETQNELSSERSLCASTNNMSSANKNTALQSKSFNRRFATKLQNSFDHVLIYEQPSLKEKALRLVPHEALKQQAKSKYDSYRLNNIDQKPYDLSDFVLIEVLAWFKNDFFKWVNQPDCIYCQTNEHMQFESNQPALESESIWMAHNVEVYRCSECKQRTRFPRYNHPSKLLDTRCGRCGEWANCFCLILRALDFDARYILDWTDHVWCEVYSSSQKRWLHADPCENALDKPLIYEHGWNKKLSYVIGFSRNECVDVTWRYTNKQNEVMSRRNECNEQWLAAFASELSRKRQASLSDSERKHLQLRLVSEIVEFLTPKKLKDGEDIGRQSGSLQWRMERGEIQVPNNRENFEFNINHMVLNGKRFSVKYNTARDTYFYTHGVGITEIKGWKKCTSSYSNMQLKQENDWKMCYLARTNGSDRAFIEWSFNLANIQMDTDRIELRCESSCFESGEINWFIECDGSRLDLDKQKESNNEYLNCRFTNDNYFVLVPLNNSIKSLKLRAELAKGNGENAWQHTQLFRQRLNDNNLYLLSLDFYFK